MKNLKKLISVIIAVIMLVSSFATVAAAGEYTDVDSKNSYYKAIKVLSGLGIAQGDDEGNFNPKADVKRSEMVAFVCRMMGEEDIATASSTNAFTDVASNHWAAGYIAWGVNRGIINGMGDGTFAPDAPVTYQDAVVMIMRALGYDRIAQRAENGGYPTGYLKLASQNKVLDNAGFDNAAAATREIIAQLIYNASTAPLVDVSYYGVSVEDDRYVIYNGKNGTDLRTLLTYTNDVLKVKAEITKTPKSDPTTCIDKAGNYMVEINITDAYDYTTASVVNELGGSNPVVVYVGETEAADLLGSTVEAYLAEDEDLNDWKLLAVIADAKSTVSETVDKDIESYNSTTGIVEYYANATDRKTTEIEVSTTATVYYNGVAVTATDWTTEGYADLEALLKDADSITFMGPKNAEYNKIFVTKYDYKIVDTVTVDEEFIKFDSTTRGSLDLNAESRNDDDFIYNIYDANGKAIALEDIAEGDVLNIVAPWSANGIDDAPYMDIYVSNETVTGKINQQKTTGEYVIDSGDAYESLVSVSIGDEGVFYLTIDGKIIKKDAATSISKNFAFLIGIEPDTSFGQNSYSLRIFTVDGIVDAPVASNFRLVAADGTYAQYKTEGNGQDALFATGGTIANTIVTPVNADADAAIAAAEATVNGRFFAYKTNANGEITELRVLATTGDIVASNATPASKKYDAEFNEFGGETIGEAPLFVVLMKATEITASTDPDYGSGGNYRATVDTDKLTIGSFSSMKDDAALDAITYMVDDEDELAAVLSVDKVAYGLEESPLAVLQSTGTSLDAEDNTVASLTFVQSGELVTLSCDYDEFGTAHGLAIGDVFQYAVDAEGEIAEIELVYDASAKALTTYATTFDVGDDDMGFVFGIVTEVADYMVLASNVNTTTGEAATSAKFKFADAEAATFASVDAKTLAGTKPENAVKVITANGIKETVKVNTIYVAVAKVNENNRIEDVVEILLDNTVVTDWAGANSYGTYDIVCD